MGRERFTMIEDGQVIGGITVEIMEELSRRIGFQVQHDFCPFKRCLNQIATGRLDAVMFVADRTDRRQFIEFVHSWPSPMKVFFYMKKGETDRLDSYEDLLNLDIGVVKGFYYSPKFDRDIRIKRVEVITEEQLPRMLLAGRIDAFAVYGDSHIHIESKFPSLEMAPYHAPGTNFGILAIGKKSPYVALKPQFDAAITAMIRDGTLDRIWNRFHPGQPMPMPESVRQKANQTSPGAAAHESIQ